MGLQMQMRIQPDEAIYYKLAIKKPGLEYNPVMSELDLSYKSRFRETYIPDAYERLILDAIRGDQEHFVRRCGMLAIPRQSYLHIQRLSYALRHSVERFCQL